MKEAKFIYKIEHTPWVSFLVVVPKNSEKLRVCINLKKVNGATIRDHYPPLSITYHAVERGAGTKAYSFLDGFSRYIQVSIDPKDQHKTTFATKWGIFTYWVMPFGFTNALATFQRLMCHAFKQYLWDFLKIIMDGFYIHSIECMEHIEHLKKIFEKYCRVYSICLNPKKCKFKVRQGKILGHIVSKNGISTNMDKVCVIVDLPRPINAKGVQCFMGHCGYY